MTKFEDSDTETADHADGSDDDRNQAGALAPEPTEIPQETPEVEDLRPDNQFRPHRWRNDS